MRRDAESLRGDGFWYLATPYSKWAAGIDDAALMAARIAGSLARYRVAVFSPIAHSHAVAMASGIDPRDHTIWIPLDDPFMDAARGLIVADVDLDRLGEAHPEILLNVYNIVMGRRAQLSQRA